MLQNALHLFNFKGVSSFMQSTVLCCLFVFLTSIDIESNAHTIEIEEIKHKYTQNGN